MPSSFFISKGCSIAKDFQAGEFGFMGSGCRISPKVSVGNYVMFGPCVFVTGSDHRFDIVGKPMIFSGRDELGYTIIGSDVWIGARAIIMSGVTIGDGTVIAANSVLTHDAEPYSVYAGVPAKKIKQRFSNQLEVEEHRSIIEGSLLRGDFCGPLE